MVYVSYNDLNKCIKNNLYKIPNNIDLIVANPRSGFIPAIIISLIKNVPMCDISVFKTDNIYKCGTTKNVKQIYSINDANKILIVEDSSYSGNSIKKIKESIPNNLKDRCEILTVYVNEKTKCMTDIYFEEINKSRIFEWNLFHHKYLNHAAVEFDVLYSNKLLIKPTQNIKSVIINDDLDKDEANALLKNISYDNIIYRKELRDEKIIICKNKNLYNVDVLIIEY